MLSKRIIKKVNDTYSVYIGKSEQSGLTELVVYQIINNDTGVIEGETSILGKAIKYCMGFEEELKEAEEMLKNGPEQLELELMDTDTLPN